MEGDEVLEGEVVKGGEAFEVGGEGGVVAGGDVDKPRCGGVLGGGFE